MPGTWATWGRDSDNNGHTSPTDIGDAVIAQGRLMCSLIGQAKCSGISGDHRSLALAGYNAGWGAVQQYNGLRHWQRMHQKGHLTGEALTRDEDLLRNLDQALEETNRLVSQAESVRSLLVLDAHFTEESGHLTPSLKLRREAIQRDFATEIERLYG